MIRAEPATLLVVDHSTDVIDQFSGLLADQFTVKAAVNGNTALAVAARHPQPDLILLEANLPEMDGYEVCRRLKEDPLTAPIPVILITDTQDAETVQKGLDLGAVDCLTQPVSPPILRARIHTQIALHDQSRHLESLVDQRTVELLRSRLEVIRQLGRLAEYKGKESGRHAIRMSWFSRYLAEAAGHRNNWCDQLFNAAPLHDIGMACLPDHILMKRGELDEEEKTLMRRHTVLGAEIIGEHDSPILKLAREIALCHHEKWDGSGYPNGLKGEDIPLSARIVAVADVFDALTSDRPYGQAWTESRAIEFLENESGRHFDPDLVSLFIGCLPRVREVQAEFGDDIASS